MLSRLARPMQRTRSRAGHGRLAKLLGVLGIAFLCTAPRGTLAATLADVSSTEASSGLRAALGKGVSKAVAELGRDGGFLGDPKVTIPLPPALAKAQQALRFVGMGGEADELKTTMNHAAEQAVAQASPVFEQSLKRMTVTDAKGILTGGDGAATAYFRRTTGEELARRFKPVVAGQTAKLGLASKYDAFAGKASQLGLVASKDANLDDYVTSRALDALFGRIAEEEHAIRQDPLGQSSSIIRKVFGAL